MDRRQALKSIVLSTGAIVSSASLLGVLQACQQKPSLSWTPKFFTQEQASIVSVVADVIIPKTDMPNATEALVAPFIDLLYQDVFEKLEGEKFSLGINEFNNQFKLLYGNDFVGSNDINQTKFIYQLYQQDEQSTASLYQLVQSKQVPENKIKIQHLYSFLFSIRELIIEAYFSSELIGESFLAYDPIPGGYQACITINENTPNWSL